MITRSAAIVESAVSRRRERRRAALPIPAGPASRRRRSRPARGRRRSRLPDAHGSLVTPATTDAPAPAITTLSPRAGRYRCWRSPAIPTRRQPRSRTAAWGAQVADQILKWRNGPPTPDGFSEPRPWTSGGPPESGNAPPRPSVPSSRSWRRGSSNLRPVPSRRSAGPWQRAVRRGLQRDEVDGRREQPAHGRATRPPRCGLGGRARPATCGTRRPSPDRGEP